MASPAPDPIYAVMPVMGGTQALTEAALADLLDQSVPVRVLIINQGVEDDFRRRLEVIAEQHSERVLLWSHQPPLPSLAATWNRALRFVWECGGEVALVVNNDVRLHPDTCVTLLNVLDTQQALFVSAVGVTADQYAEFCAKEPRLYIGWDESHGGPDFSCFMLTKEAHETYPFDEGFIPAYGEDCDLHRRYMLGGSGDRIFSINLPYHHVDKGSGTLKSLSGEAKAKLERRLGQSREYYRTKWGGPINGERWTIPFDPSTDQDGVTNPELQRACLESV